MKHEAVVNIIAGHELRHKAAMFQLGEAVVSEPTSTGVGGC